jgi:hypothetical protein
MDPATITGRPALSATSRASAAAALQLVQRQAEAVRAEAVGEDDVRARVDEPLVDGAHIGRLLDIPELAWGAVG